MFALAALVVAAVAWVLQAFADNLSDPWAWAFAVLVLLSAHFAFGVGFPFDFTARRR